MVAPALTLSFQLCKGMTGMQRRTAVLAVGIVLAARCAWAADLHANMALATPAGPGASVGTITVSETPQGVVFKTDLKGLPPGPHGFHVHEGTSCQPSTANNQPVPAGAAGGHLDPGHTAKHLGPSGEGHLGDLPVLNVAADGTAKESLTAPRIKSLDAIRGRALMIHAGGDNYSDEPAPLGGGGARIACGILEE